MTTSEIKKDPSDFSDNQSDDYDNDGLSEFDGDCDDLNQDVLGPSLWYVDSDGDGFGNPLTEVEACQVDLLELDDIYVAEGTDCDDENPEIHPDMVDPVMVSTTTAAERLTTIRAPMRPSGTTTTTMMVLVMQGLSAQLHGPVGYVSDKTDCDDSNADAYPNAPEYCDGVDTSQQRHRRRLCH